MENIQEYLTIAGMVISLCAAIAAITPTPKDDSIMKKVMDIVNVLGLNIGNAKNKK
jgi:hypothetical protein